MRGMLGARSHSTAWIAAVLLSGVACAQLFAVQPHIAHPPSQALPPDPTTPPGGAPAAPQLTTLPAAAENSTKTELESARRDWALAARSTAPGQTWQDAANAADWVSAAQLIDALPEPERSEPGTRYARAVAARELGQYDIALRELTDLESELPLLHDEIKLARAHCQLEMGAHEEAYQYFTREQSPENLILAARACLNGKDLPRAQQTVDKAFQKIKKQGSETRRGRRNEIEARALRATIAERGARPKLAARDWLWLATEAATEKAADGADEAYERTSGQKLSKAQRLERLRGFSREGMLERSLTEHARLLAAPGTPPPAVELTSALGWAYYYSRRDYARAADLFRQAAAQSSENRVRHLFFAARARSRANQDDQAINEYKQLLAQYPGNGFTEQTQYRIAHLEYGLGRWEKAEKAYTEYLDRFGKHGGEYASASRYELAIARLGAKQRTHEAASTLGQMARRERRPERRAMLSHLEAVALELTGEPKKVEEAVNRYRGIVETQPLSFAALVSAARLKQLGSPEVHQGTLGGDLVVKPLDNAFVPELPEKARLLAAMGLHTDAERALFDQRAEVRRRYADDDARALCAMYGSLDRGYRSYSLADGLLRSEELGSPPSSHNLWAWRCAYPRPYRDVVDAVEARYSLPPHLVHAVMRQESGFRPNVVSPVGAVGLMQLMPYTALRAAQEITEQPGAPWVPDPSRPTNILNNVELGGFYLGKLLGMLRGQLPVAVAAYNAGPSAVSRWLAGGEDLPIDVWVARIPYAETRDYVSYVLGNWLAYRYLDAPSELPELSLAMIPGTRAAPDAY